MNRRSMLKHLGGLAVVAALVPVAPVVLAQQAGAGFQSLPSKIKGDDPQKIELIEFFHYGCPHCRNFDPLLHTWLKTLPEDVSFRRVPAVWGNPQLRELARLYYTLETLGEVDRLNESVFVAVQEKKLPLHTEKGVRDWVAAQGLDEKVFMDTYKSFGLNAQLQRAEQLGKTYQVNGVPTMAVGGRYLTSASMTGSHEGTLKMVDELIIKSRAELGG